MRSIIGFLGFLLRRVRPSVSSTSKLPKKRTNFLLEDKNFFIQFLFGIQKTCSRRKKKLFHIFKIGEKTREFRSLMKYKAKQ